MKIFIIECQTEDQVNRLEEALKMFATADTEEKDKEEIVTKELPIEERCKQALKYFDAKVKNVGYRYIIEAVKLLEEDYSYLRNTVNRLYPTIAKKYNVTTSSVERGIRHEILTIENDENFRKIFGKKVTNTEFLARMHQYVTE